MTPEEQRKEEQRLRLHAMLYPAPTAAEQALGQKYGSSFTTTHSLLEKHEVSSFYLERYVEREAIDDVIREFAAIRAVLRQVDDENELFHFVRVGVDEEIRRGR